MADEFVNYYQVLGVSPKATLDEIRAAFYRKSGGVESRSSTNTPVTDAQRQINLAYDVLSNPERRRVYDEALAKWYRQRQLSTVVPPPLPNEVPSRRNWSGLLRTAILVLGGIAAGIIIAAAAITSFKRPPSKEELAAVEAKKEAEEEVRRAKEAKEAQVKLEFAAAAARLKAIQAEGEATLAVLKKLEAEVDLWESQVRPLLVNDRGKLLATDEDSIRAFQSIWRVKRTTKSEVLAIQARIKGLLAPVDEQLAKAEPHEASGGSITAQLKAESARIEELIEEAKAPRLQVERLLAVAEQSPRAGTVTLQQAIDDLAKKELDSRNSKLAEIERESKVKLAEAEAAKKKIEAEAEAKAVEAKAMAAKREAEDALEQERLIKKAKTAETRQLLAMFFAKGYWQPDDSRTPDKVPISYSKLVATGCLDSSIDGLKRLYAVANNRDCMERPFWREPSNRIELLSDAKHQQLLKMQRALAESGPTLVELKLLEP